MHPECFLRYIADISWNGVRNNNDEIPLCISSGKYISRGSKSYPPISRDVRNEKTLGYLHFTPLIVSDRFIPIPFSVDGILLIENVLETSMTIFMLASRKIHVDVSISVAFSA
ncbi:hypothetical protein T4E_6478 [Trichinella pseudospiralis]|uniref:Uncharacterized protein n=1 Tax=Trichinella pseudospiralis TaxID=6337 RepID=A0A0V0XL39_TRIPS|nr:hypothetical protein T4E_6478 [Trichinella pseudospiralis]